MTSANFGGTEHVSARKCRGRATINEATTAAITTSRTRHNTSSSHWVLTAVINMLSVYGVDSQRKDRPSGARVELAPPHATLSKTEFGRLARALEKSGICPAGRYSAQNQESKNQERLQGCPAHTSAM